ncbi:hypothetical protein [Amycolatopsis sp. CA-230715]|uniref:hypothetical protein n=1 Tax=Amycolatopsis sp. CA-230715 TaxID=2745196 RepID=UPI001C01AA49|nr:hypothetical protein [Amycolatopsis sp. CA-230715]QWF78396.1 hypothetical protein HUW46_01792 [Amycolatopsis sp. CA-230715]
MPRTTWEGLPALVRAVIERECGRVLRAEEPSAGRNSDFSATVYTDRGPVFCKGITDAHGKRGAMHRHESMINKWLPHEVAPRLLWQAEADGWLLLGFEHVAGCHADLSPGSPDLPLVTEAMTTLARELAQCPSGVPSLADKMAWLAGWRRLRHDPPAELDNWSREQLDLLVEWEARGLEAVAGDALLHTDLHSLNILVADRARVIDWAWARSGAAWTDTAHLVVRLIDAGHRPSDAERWAAGIPGWQDVSGTELTGFAVALAGMWTYLRHADPQPQRPRLAGSARTWAEHRLRTE